MKISNCFNNFRRYVGSVWYIKVPYRYVKSSLPTEKKRVCEAKKEAVIRQNKIKDIVHKIYGKGAPYVLGGPFAGMRYIFTANGSQLLPKLLGTYEEPIRQWIQSIVESDKYQLIIDVGCAEGYYAVGFACAKSKPIVFAFDIDDSALENAKLLAELNGVSKNIKFANRFDAAALAEILSGHNNKKSLIFMDVEGAELELLNTKENPSMLQCDFLVELHDCFVPGLTEKIIERLGDTHQIQIIIDNNKRSESSGLTKSYNLSKSDVEFSVDERRPSYMRWMLAKKI